MYYLCTVIELTLLYLYWSYHATTISQTQDEQLYFLRSCLLFKQAASSTVEVYGQVNAPILCQEGCWYQRVSDPNSAPHVYDDGRSHRHTNQPCDIWTAEGTLTLLSYKLIISDSGRSYLFAITWPDPISRIYVIIMTTILINLPINIINLELILLLLIFRLTFLISN